MYARLNGSGGPSAVASISSAIVATVCLLALTGCGSGGVDAGGFSSSNRNAAQNALDTLQSTSVSTIILQLSATNEIPAICRVHLESRKPLTFKLFLAWIPRGQFRQSETGNVYSWLQILLNRDGVTGNNWHVVSSPRKATLEAAYGDALSKPFDRCEILAGGGVKVLRTTAIPTLNHVVAPKVPVLAPAFALPRLNGSGSLSLQSLRGKTVVLTFFSSYLAEARRLAPMLESESRRWANRGVVFVAVDEQDLAPAARAFIRRYGIAFPAVREASGSLIGRYNVENLPETYFVDRTGHLVRPSLSGVPSAARLDAAIKLALASNGR